MKRLKQAINLGLEVVGLGVAVIIASWLKQFIEGEDWDISLKGRTTRKPLGRVFSDKTMLRWHP